MNGLLGIDLGTQGTKAALFSEQGECLGQGFVASRPQRPRDGELEEDPEDQVAAVCASIRRCLKDAGACSADVNALAIDGQMAGVLGVGRDGHHVTPYDSWLDTRCTQQVELMEHAVGDRVISLTGCAPSYNHGPKMLWCRQHRKATYRRVRAFVQPASYAAMRLCGLSGDNAFIDTTYLHFSGFADNVNKRWDAGLCDAVDLDIAKLPQIVESTQIVGGLTKDAAKRCGLAVDTPVAAGCGDSAASFLSCGATQAGVAVDVSGTASVFATTTDQFVVDRQTRTLGCGRSVLPGLWHPYAYINGGGLNIEWFRKRLLSGGVSKTDALDFADLEMLVASVRPDPGLPLFVPHFSGRVSPNQPAIRGAWANLGWNHGLGEMYYAILESVALEYAIYRDRIDALAPDPPIRELRVTGGGQQSAYWNRLKADTLGVPVRTITRPHGAPMGSALVAGHAVGLIKDLPKTAQQWAKPDAPLRPRVKPGRILRDRLTSYRRLLEQLGTLES